MPCKTCGYKRTIALGLCYKCYPDAPETNKTPKEWDQQARNEYSRQPEIIKKREKYAREYNARPEVKQRKKEFNQTIKQKTKRNKYMREYMKKRSGIKCK